MPSSRRGAFADSTIAALESDLRTAIEGEVRFSRGDRALYATDASNYRQVPIGVVLPRSSEDIVQTIASCRAHGVPVLPRGGGTSLAGQCCNVAVVIDTSKYLNSVLSLDSDARTAWVEPGCVLDDLRDRATAEGLTFGPDPSTHDHCTLGGMIGNDSCGVHSVMAGRTAENIRRLDVVTYDGLRLTVGRTDSETLAAIHAGGGRKADLYDGLQSLGERYGNLIRARFPAIPRRVSGFNLEYLLPEKGLNLARALVGTEGTCAFVLGAEVELVANPPARVLLVLGFEDVYRAAEAVPTVLEARPIGLEGMDDDLIRYMDLKGMYPAAARPSLPEGAGWLFAEFGGSNLKEACQTAESVRRKLSRGTAGASARLVTDPAEAERLWKVRESGLGATAHVPGMRETWPGWEDAAVAPERLAPYLKDFRTLLERYGYACALYGHFGDGCIHVRIDFDLGSEKGQAHYRAFAYEAADLVVRYGGSLSGEHGDGQSRGELLSRMYGPELVEAFREFKSLWDPDWKMNPGKVVEPDGMTEHLRPGPGHPRLHPRSQFKFGGDGRNFAKAAGRCVGVGKCRRHHGGVMCPSYMVTHEEKHSTRGRARLLYEMLEGDPLTEGWRSEEVRDALDLCLACKGCKRDCPVSVDMASYKAEFLSHFYARRLRPRAAFSMGLIYWWARLASHLPMTANRLAELPVSKRLAGIAPQRHMPAFAPETFRTGFLKRGKAGAGPRGRLVLLPDTFTNFFEPPIAWDAVKVLEAAGYEVVLPPRSLCCGRPLYAWGMLDLARRLLRQVLETLRQEILAGTPLVVLEPACLASFRDELPALFPEEELARRLAEQSYMLSEFLVEVADHRPSRLSRPALVQAHCHHHAVMGFDAEEELMRRLGLDFEVLDSGCCGMAGSFGFEKEHFEVAQAAGERVLLPAVRGTSEEIFLLANGFSCREQIRQGSAREPKHIAELLALAAGQGG